MSHYPKVSRPRGGGFVQLPKVAALMQYKPHFVSDIDLSKPKRKNLITPDENNAFVKPIKQSFMKNPRMMPNTKIMLTLLSGWAGKGDAIETTVGVIGKHLTRCRRQIHRYLQDAVEEGFITYTRRKDKIGRYIGIKIYLNFAAIRFTRFVKKQTQNKDVKAAENIDVTLKAETNTKHYLSYNNPQDDTELWDRLSRLATAAGYLNVKPPS